MNRRQFLLSVAASAMYSAVNSAEVSNIFEVGNDTLSKSMLTDSQENSQKKIAYLGQVYLETYPEEEVFYTGNKNVDLINDFDINKSENILKLIESKVAQDYINEQFVCIKGWWISRTEARLCASVFKQKMFL